MVLFSKKFSWIHPGFGCFGVFFFLLNPVHIFLPQFLHEFFFSFFSSQFYHEFIMNSSKFIMNFTNSSSVFLTLLFFSNNLSLFSWIHCFTFFSQIYPFFSQIQFVNLFCAFSQMHICPHFAEDLAESSLLNKLLHTSLVENSHHVEVLQQDPSSPLFSIRTFEELHLKKELLQGVYTMGFNRPSKIQANALPILMAHP